MVNVSVNVLTDIENWTTWLNEQDWTLLPYAIKVGNQHLPESWEGMWGGASPYSFVLESGKDGAFTIAGIQPVDILRGKRTEAVRLNADGSQAETCTGAPLEVLKRWMAPFRAPSVPGLTGFCGGFAGYLSYNVARSLERLPNLAEDDLELDDYIWLRMEEVWVYDHKAEELYCLLHLPVKAFHADTDAESTAAGASPVSPEPPFFSGAAAPSTSSPSTPSALPVPPVSPSPVPPVPAFQLVSPERLHQLYEAAESRARRMLQDWQRWVDLAAQSAGPARRRDILASSPAPLLNRTMAEEGWTTPFEQQRFEAAVRRVQDYISAGDVFQVNLSLRRQRELAASAEGLYEWFRLINPSPYMGLLRFPDFQLVSGSPELLVTLRDGRIGARPIAGTRRRGRTEAEDQAMAAELLSSEKERAEHIMLVDLERNDLGRVAAYGTVRVSELLKVEYYSHVMHLVSQVDGGLESGRSPYDLIGAVFPGGTITGAPKIRTMEIIEELEPVTRGPYTGSIGWIDYQGNMELNIVIRTMIVKEGTGYIQTGAGIVIDSDPYREFRECDNKAKAARAAVYYSEIEEDKIRQDENEELSLEYDTGHR